MYIRLSGYNSTSSAQFGIILFNIFFALLLLLEKIQPFATFSQHPKEKLGTKLSSTFTYITRIYRINNVNGIRHGRTEFTTQWATMNLDAQQQNENGGRLLKKNTAVKNSLRHTVKKYGVIFFLSHDEKFFRTAFQIRVYAFYVDRSCVDVAYRLHLYNAERRWVLILTSSCYGFVCVIVEMYPRGT